MAAAGGTNIVREGLQFYLDLYNLYKGKGYQGKPTTNFVPSNVTIDRYNNPGFSGTNIDTGDTLSYTGTPIWKLTHYVTAENQLSRLYSGEGFGARHTMNTRLDASKIYLASIYFYSPFNITSLSHTYSNIVGWGNNSTVTTYENLGNGWKRFFTLYRNQRTDRDANNTPLSERYSSNIYTTFTFNTTAQSDVIVESTAFNPAQYIGNSYYRGTYQISNTVQDDYNSIGVTLLDWGLDSNMTKPSYDAYGIWNYPNPTFSETIFYKLRIGSTGGSDAQVRMRTYTYGMATSLSDNKYWKITFDSSEVAVNREMVTYWSAPMIEEVPSTSYKKPSVYIGASNSTATRSTETALKGRINNQNHSLSAVSFTTDNKITFDGTDDSIDTGKTASDLGIYDSDYTLEAFVKFNSTSGDHMVFGTTQTSGRQGMHIGCRNGVIYQGHYASDRNAGSLSTGIWYHLVWTYDQSTTIGAIYKDGVYQGGGSQGSFIGTTNILIGRWASNYANMQVAKVRIYNKVLGSDGIFKNFISFKNQLNS